MKKSVRRSHRKEKAAIRFQTAASTILGIRRLWRDAKSEPNGIAGRIDAPTPEINLLLAAAVARRERRVYHPRAVRS
jgi:hypothetical protein